MVSIILSLILSLPKRQSLTKLQYLLITIVIDVFNVSSNTTPLLDIIYNKNIKQSSKFTTSTESTVQSRQRPTGYKND